MNIREVAKRAKVSTATVSRTINNSEKVDPGTAARVQKAIQELNFYPNTHARTLVSGRSRMMGLIISDITNPFFPELVKSFQDAALRSSQEVIIGNTDYNPKRMAGCIRRMVERKVDGVAIMTSEADPGLMTELTRRNIPTVFMDTGKSGPHSANIRIDYAQGIHEAMQHLFSLNHRRIAFITGPMNLESVRIRCEAYLSGLKSCGLSDRALIEKGDHRIEGGAMAMRNLLKLPQRPTAVVASNDLSAIGALGVIHNAGLRVPDDISLIGFDDIAFAHWTQPPLTTVILSRTQLAVTAFAALEALIRKEDGSQTDYTIPTHLVMRKSTRAI
ncbi:MAG TPA: LacI family DNA-binding transcriptional regulator [Candidatus Acidoferrum sp.]|jgi:DNA-binding LacI/PurR family transcriptional regulator|nr:LacI family DNA-binding transcriptional regulator [Candidatus Acidoferrum sp.]